MDYTLHLHQCPHLYVVFPGNVDTGLHPFGSLCALPVEDGLTEVCARLEVHIQTVHTWAVHVVPEGETLLIRPRHGYDG